MKQMTTHEEQVQFLKKIEGQVRGVQKMIESKEYCVDILNQIHAVICALARVEEKILEKHFEGCVARTVGSGSLADKKKKLEEVLQLIHKYRKL